MQCSWEGWLAPAGSLDSDSIRTTGGPFSNRANHTCRFCNASITDSNLKASANKLMAAIPAAPASMH